MPSKSTIVRIIQAAAPVGAALAPRLAARALERLFLSPSRHIRPPRELDWIANAQRTSIRFDHTRQLPIYSWGHGPTILLVHGWSGRGSQLGGFVEQLVNRGFRVVSFDAPGHGEADGRLSSLPELATAIERVASRVGPLRAIVAHSLGAAATTIALSRGLPVEKLVYVAPPENPGNFLYRAARYLGFGDEIARRTRTRIEQRFAFLFENARGTTLAPTIDVPLLVIHDLHDSEVPYEEGVRLAEAWTGAELMTTNGLGHHRVVRAPEVIDAAVEFLIPKGERPAARLPSVQPVQPPTHMLSSDAQQTINHHTLIGATHERS